MTASTTPFLPAPRVLLLPGWLDSDASHWQSRWEQLHGDQRVTQDDWQWPRRGDWMARLEEVLLQADTPAVLVAHSLGCHLVAAWAAHSQQRARVVGALLVAPPDLERGDLPPQLAPWRPWVRERLPFPSVAVVSSNDPYCDAAHGASMAAAWGSELVSVGDRGHVNGESALGDWPEGRTMLATLASRRA
ncbi:MAG: serine hydrolase family protein [Rhizobacter sp.]|nr:serine hydrolase family protein [Rhizobacter sp.]